MKAEGRIWIESFTKGKTIVHEHIHHKTKQNNYIYFTKPIQSQESYNIQIWYEDNL
jgi:hypothetical protein